MFGDVLFATEHLTHTETQSNWIKKNFRFPSFVIVFVYISITITFIAFIVGFYLHLSAERLFRCREHRFVFFTCVVFWLCQHGDLISEMVLLTLGCHDTPVWLDPKQMLHCVTAVCPTTALRGMSGSRGAFSCVWQTHTCTHNENLSEQMLGQSLSTTLHQRCTGS